MYVSVYKGHYTNFILSQGLYLFSFFVLLSAPKHVSVQVLMETVYLFARCWFLDIRSVVTKLLTNHCHPLLVK